MHTARRPFPSHCRRPYRPFRSAHSCLFNAVRRRNYYAGVCLSVCLSVCPVSVTHQAAVPQLIHQGAGLDAASARIGMSVRGSNTLVLFDFTIE